MASSWFLRLFQGKYFTTCCRPVCFRNSFGIPGVDIGQNGAVSIYPRPGQLHTQRLLLVSISFDDGTA